MKTLNIATALAFALATLTAIAAQAQSTSETPKSRAEVRAETAAAIRSGDVSSGFEGLKMNELLPTLYPRAEPRRSRAAGASSAPAEVIAASAASDSRK